MQNISCGVLATVGLSRLTLLIVLALCPFKGEVDKVIHVREVWIIPIGMCGGFYPCKPLRGIPSSGEFLFTLPYLTRGWKCMRALTKFRERTLWKREKIQKRYCWSLCYIGFGYGCRVQVCDECHTHLIAISRTQEHDERLTCLSSLSIFWCKWCLGGAREFHAYNWSSGSQDECRSQHWRHIPCP